MTFTETSHVGGFLLSEANGHFSRENATLSGTTSIPAGSVLGRAVAAGGAVAVGTPTGNGAITVGTTIGADVVVGTYKLVCVVAASNAGTFNLYAPDGSLVRQITVGGGATPSDHLTITIADGGSDFAVHDTWAIAVTEDAYIALAPEATNGGQTAAAILYAGVDVSDGDKPCVVIVRNTEVNQHELAWPSAITDEQKSAAIEQLAIRGILLR